MTTISLVLTVLAVSADAFCCGFALGGQRTRIRALSGLYIATWALALCCAAALAGHEARVFAPQAWAAPLGGALLMAAAVMALAEAAGQRKRDAACVWRRNAGAGETTLVGIAVALDASLAAFSLGIAGVYPVAVALLMACAHGGLALVGNRLGLRSVGRLRDWYVFIPGGVLLALALARFYT
ncbi:MAG: manganese efflux pump [Oscillospiraceae bacterium]|nr:manganese efflux pump [Oscillospiraceae bacterium]